MVKNFLFILLFIIITSPLQAQNLKKEIIWLKTGEVYRGKIVMQNERVLMLQAENGKRYQFLISDIEKIELQSYTENFQNLDSKTKNSDFGICAEVNVGVVTKSRISLPVSPNYGIAIALGANNAFGTNVFAGIGGGVETILLSNEKENFYSVPLFLQIHMPFGGKKISPAVNGKAGYAISLNDEYKSNLYFNISGGVNIKTEDVNSFFLGLYIRQIDLYGRVIEKNELGTFVKNGNAPLTSIGLQVLFLF